MTNSAGAVQNGLVLRLSVPGSGEMAGVGPEMAAKLAQQLGLDPAAARKVGEMLPELAAQLSPTEAGPVSFEFQKRQSELLIEARHGSRVAERRVPLGA